MHEVGKGHKGISGNLDVHQSMVTRIVYEWRKFTPELANLCRWPQVHAAQNVQWGKETSYSVD